VADETLASGLLATISSIEAAGGGLTGEDGEFFNADFCGIFNVIGDDNLQPGFPASFNFIFSTGLWKSKGI